MPRISAPTVAEHHARQREAILTAAGELFAAQGVVATDLKDVAAAVGLSRTALYRYFPDRDRLFLAWADRLLDRVLADMDHNLDRHVEPVDRIDAWIEYQLQHVAGDRHAVGRRVAEELGALSPELRDGVTRAHQTLHDRIMPTITQLVSPDRDAAMLTRMAGAAVQAAAADLEPGQNMIALAADVRRAIHGLLGLSECT